MRQKLVLLSHLLAMFFHDLFELKLQLSDVESTLLCQNDRALLLLIDLLKLRVLCFQVLIGLTTLIELRLKELALSLVSRYSCIFRLILLLHLFNLLLLTIDDVRQLLNLGVMLSLLVVNFILLDQVVLEALVEALLKRVDIVISPLDVAFKFLTGHQLFFDQVS